jgi:hypothetical protein
MPPHTINNKKGFKIEKHHNTKTESALILIKASIA